MSWIHPKALSARELAARRRNAQNSTGPRTPRGKARASLNALYHAERSERFYSFLRSFGFSPRHLLTLDRKIRVPSEGDSPVKSVLLSVGSTSNARAGRQKLTKPAKVDLTVG